MKNNLIGAVLVFGFATSALAAAPTTDAGKVTIKGTVGSTVAMSWDSGGTPNTPAPAATPDGSALDHVVDFTDVAATNTSGDTVVEKVVAFRLRSNAAYTLKAKATLTSDAVAGDTDALALDDIGFGISAIENPADDALVSGTHTNDGAGYAYSATVAAGEVTFGKTLDDVSTQQDIAGGARISKGGTASSLKNYIKVETTYGILPQFFTPSTGFTAVVDYTVATP